MSKQLKVDALCGHALVWAAIRAMGVVPHIGAAGVCFRGDHGSWEYPEVNDEEAAALMRKYWIGLERPSRGQVPPQWRALADYAGPHKSGFFAAVVESFSPDMAVAVYRAFVKSRLGDVVEIPADLADIVGQEEETSVSDYI